ncbi:MAG: inositol monophosphatase family protein [Candidatus Omnitrophica bacterium]|nr:inositol monophosphatase family protein [Candidatus Omnitrophota bacterium]
MNYLNVAIAAAQRAGAVHKKYFRKIFAVKTKSTSFDLVTIADKEAEKEAVSLIKKHYPSHNFICEENLYPRNACEYTWIIDPLDGTNNFVCGIAIFCVSIALMYKNKLLVGVVYDVINQELFYAESGKGAFLNGKRIYVNKVDDLKHAMLITGFYYNRDKEMVKTLNTIKRFMFKHILGLRRLGSAALDLCFVACGRAAGFWEFELSPWDFAAGKLIIEESGGIVTDNRGAKPPLTSKHFIVASNGKIHERMLRVINEGK